MWNLGGQGPRGRLRPGQVSGQGAGALGLDSRPPSLQGPPGGLQARQLRASPSPGPGRPGPWPSILLAPGVAGFVPAQPPEVTCPDVSIPHFPTLLGRVHLPVQVTPEGRMGRSQQLSSCSPCGVGGGLGRTDPQQEGGRGGRSQPGGAAAPGGQGKSPQGGWGWGLSRGLRHLRPSRGREVVIRLHSFPAWGRKQVPSTVILEKVGKGAVTGRLSPVRLRADVRQTVVTEQERRAKLCPQDVDTARGGPRSKGSAVTARTRVWSR